MKLKELKKATLVWGAISKEALSLLGEKQPFLVPEQRPYLVGLTHNIPLLRRNNIRFVYCTDNMLGHLFFQEKIKEAFIFYAKKIEEGFICPCGSLYVYLLSKLHNVEVKFFPQGEFKESGDKDASTLRGKLFVEEKNLEFVVSPQEELIKYV